jgi:alkylated DNA repair dioxygenase AlkB
MVGTLPVMEPALDTDAAFERIQLDEGSWVDVARGWLRGSAALYAHLEQHVEWVQGKVWRYEKYISEPRLGAACKPATAPHPVLAEAHRALEGRYHARFAGFSLQYYRDRRDSVKLHRDREMRWLDDTVVAILTTGARRPFLIQPRDTYDASAARDLSPAGGDLMVFGGRFQADWLHGVPKVRTPVRGRISVQWRYTSRRGVRDTNPGYYAPREFSRGSRGT